MAGDPVNVAATTPATKNDAKTKEQKGVDTKGTPLPPPTVVKPDPIVAKVGNVGEVKAKDRVRGEKKRAESAKTVWERLEGWLEDREAVVDEDMIKSWVKEYISKSPASPELSHLTDRYGTHGGPLHLLTHIETCLSSFLTLSLTTLLTLSSPVQIFTTYSSAYRQVFEKANALDRVIAQSNAELRDETAADAVGGIPQILFPDDTSRQSTLRPVFKDYGYEAPRSILQMMTNLWREDLHSAISGKLEESVLEFVRANDGEIIFPSTGKLVLPPWKDGKTPSSSIRESALNVNGGNRLERLEELEALKDFIECLWKLG
ncbi:hypothetical protein BT69DRAFT_872032 [Atractiella rhizophila]|nr:hypothetical protein BT69DRAFT_872032 [Atractiella rhizophila]